MTGRARRGIRLTIGLVAALTAPGLVAGCGSGGKGGAPHASASPSGFSAARLSAALPATYGDFGATTQATSGTYASLPTSASAGGVGDAPASVTFTPAKCKQVIWNGPDKARFGADQAAVVVLRKQGDTTSATQLWAELIAAPAGTAKAALGTGPQAGCGTVRGRYQRRELSFAEEKPPAGLGSGARGALVRSSGSPDTRTIAFLGDGYVGVAFAQGDVSRTELGAFARQVYGTAHAKLG